MKSGIYRAVLIIIMLTIVATIGLQVRWNVRNYNENRKQLIAEIQNTFDTSVENYYAEKIKKEQAVFSRTLRGRFPGNFRFTDSSRVNPGRVQTVIIKDKSAAEKRRNLRFIYSSDIPSRADTVNVRRIRPPDSRTREIMAFTERVFASLSSGDTIDMKKFTRNVSKEFGRKNIKIDYRIERFEDDISRHKENPALINVLANTTYLPPYQNLRLSYPDPTLMIFKRSLTEIILSLLLSLSVVSCLLYLLHIINRQKKVDEIRNDLISNITHEFKTPITTIGSAIEGIRDFNVANDKEKTSRYLDISENQLGKLSMMVEKLLETATLDTDSLALKKEKVELVELLQNLVEKCRITTQKTITFSADDENVFVSADAFHLENAVSNVIDNAIKYGGNSVHISLENKNRVEIIIADNGSIDRWHREKIFEKFYRIPKGNIHDVKGFGIGLYYSRKIIEKHGGTLELVPGSGKTVFKIIF